MFKQIDKEHITILHSKQLLSYTFVTANDSVVDESEMMMG